MDYDKLYELMYLCAYAERRPSLGRRIVKQGESTFRQRDSNGR